MRWPRWRLRAESPLEHLDVLARLGGPSGALGLVGSQPERLEPAHRRCRKPRSSSAPAWHNEAVLVVTPQRSAPSRTSLGNSRGTHHDFRASMTSSPATDNTAPWCSST